MTTREKISECFELLRKEDIMVDFADLCAIAARNFGIKRGEVEAWSAENQLNGTIKGTYVGASYFVAANSNV